MGCLRRQNIHFICSSNKAPVMEMAKPLVKQFLALEDGIVLFDALLQCDVIAVAPILCFLCDNPRASQLCSHMGATSNMFCRICNVRNLCMYMLFFSHVLHCFLRLMLDLPSILFVAVDYFCMLGVLHLKFYTHFF